MVGDDAGLVVPVPGPKPDGLAKRCLMAANLPDVDLLHKTLARDGTFKSRNLFLSRLYYGYEHTATCLAGPFFGAPQAAVLLESLIVWGISEVIFLGWCGSINDGVRTGDVILPGRAWIDDGTSGNYRKPGMPGDAADPAADLQLRLKTRLTGHGVDVREGPVWSTDAIFRETPAKIQRFREKGALAVEMEAAALFAVGGYRGISVGNVLVVSDELSDAHWRPGFRNPVFKEQRRRICRILADF